MDEWYILHHRSGYHKHLVAQQDKGDCLFGGGVVVVEGFLDYYFCVSDWLGEVLLYLLIS